MFKTRRTWNLVYNIHHLPNLAPFVPWQRICRHGCPGSLRRLAWKSFWIDKVSRGRRSERYTENVPTNEEGDIQKQQDCEVKKTAMEHSEDEEEPLKGCKFEGNTQERITRGPAELPAHEHGRCRHPSTSRCAPKEATILWNFLMLYNPKTSSFFRLRAQCTIFTT